MWREEGGDVHEAVALEGGEGVGGWRCLGGVSGGGGGGGHCESDLLNLHVSLGIAIL